jgi:hypothetical protein
MACNLRHLDEKPLDFDASPWPLIRGALLAFLRHQHSLYNERLRARCEYDKDFRDTLTWERFRKAVEIRLGWLGQVLTQPSEAMFSGQSVYVIRPLQLRMMRGARLVILILG